MDRRRLFRTTPRRMVYKSTDGGSNKILRLFSVGTRLTKKIVSLKNAQKCAETLSCFACRTRSASKPTGSQVCRFEFGCCTRGSGLVAKPCLQKLPPPFCTVRFRTAHSVFGRLRGQRNTTRCRQTSYFNIDHCASGHSLVAEQRLQRLRPLLLVPFSKFEAVLFGYLAWLLG